MKELKNISLDLATPSINAILKAQGITDSTRASERILRLADDALTKFKNLAEPAGMLSEIPKSNFKQVFHGEGQNEDDAPLEEIYKVSDHLTLFAVTLGQKVCTEITDLFENNDFALGSMLDSAASEGAELTAAFVEKDYRDNCFNNDRTVISHGTMRFSPGYCGWHISGQKKLFEILNPEKIGVELNNSYLMTPLKSISGVIVLGKKEIFRFDDIFDFCADCKEHSCQDRIRTLMRTD